MIFAELKYIRQDNNKNCSRSKLLRLCYVIHRFQKKPEVAPKRGSIALAVSGKYSKQHGKRRREVVNLFSDDIPGVSVSEGRIEKLTPSQDKLKWQSIGTLASS